jgi:hypothetical protein
LNKKKEIFLGDSRKTSQKRLSLIEEDTNIKKKRQLVYRTERPPKQYAKATETKWRS